MIPRILIDLFVYHEAESLLIMSSDADDWHFMLFIQGEMNDKVATASASWFSSLGT
ncbi:hypothetical protein Fmac_001332 [Flemingia macrophylla]|uniref:Uncharacterized protein n=1 Tax=Flemingia macrophylla TaxID=520843 RepID=A0ABD1NGT4_9FABA